MVESASSYIKYQLKEFAADGFTEKTIRYIGSDNTRPAVTSINRFFGISTSNSKKTSCNKRFRTTQLEKMKIKAVRETVNHEYPH